MKLGKAPEGDKLALEYVKYGGEASIEWLWLVIKEAWRDEGKPKGEALLSVRIIGRSASSQCP